MGLESQFKCLEKLIPSAQINEDTTPVMRHEESLKKKNEF
jgi:hypothetical protein